jgi:hypothetical protein
MVKEIEAKRRKFLEHLSLMGISEYLNRKREHFVITSGRCKNDFKLFHREN